VRAVIEHNLLYDGPKRLWYLGPMFRHERPQRGRYRQFHQVGVEALGLAGPEVDAEVIAMGQRLWDDLGLEGLQLQINSIGDAPERARHRQDLIAHFEKHADLLDEDGRRRLHANPLRILDSKTPAMQEIIEQAPKLIDYLEAPSREHFEQLRGYLADLGIPATLNPRLVRGMDYYNRTVFEWVTDRLGAQATVCGGGRYDSLIEMLGGKPAPACGFAIGVERLLDLVEQADGLSDAQSLDVYLISSGEGTMSAALRAAEALRARGIEVLMHAGGGSFKSQFKRAGASAAQLALIIGEDELRAGEATLKWLREGETGQGSRQERIRLDDVADAVTRALLGQTD
jgi:histidine--tRNA ligase